MGKAIGGNERFSLDHSCVSTPIYVQCNECILRLEGPLVSASPKTP